MEKSIKSLLILEKERQQGTINLIASENYASLAVRQAEGSCLTNKYAEGLPGKRYYAGCQIIDEIESLAIEDCKRLFGAEHVNVQPHSGSQANMAAYMALMKPGDTLMGMHLPAGGHLTHGHPASFSGIFYKTISYGVDHETHLLDYDAIEALAYEYKPKVIVAGASAYARTIDFERFRKIADAVDAYLVADIAHIAGLVATGLHPSPVGLADIVTSTTHKTLRGPRGGLIMSKPEFAERIDRAIMPGLQGGPFMHTIAAKAVAFHEALQPSFRMYQEQVIKSAQALARALQERGYTILTGGTDTHLFVVDLRALGLTGRDAESILESVGITSSRSAIPGDEQKPWIGSGIRFGTPALTTRGMGESEMQKIAAFIDETLKNHHNQQKMHAIQSAIKQLCIKFPVACF